MNTSFLQRVAQTFWREKQDQVSELTFVFPNRRAGLFFRKYLAEEAQIPLFAPAVLTINQLFQQLSQVQLADNIDLLFRLYKVYIAERKQLEQVETFDDFLFWGRMMLSDFNEVDQHLVDASELFSNLRDLKEVEQRFSHLTAEQVESVDAFVRSMHEGDTNAFRERFLTIWNTLLPIYTRFREELLQDGLAYTGLLQRMVIESLKGSNEQEWEGKRYVFIGFNALTGVEKALMEQLRDRGIADFYWDYEAEWLRDPNNRASLFYTENVRTFPSIYTIPSVQLTTPRIHWVRVASSVGQTEVIKNLLRNNRSETSAVNWTQVGIVLPNENMLLPIRTAIPAEVDTINITMGQPLKQTAAYALILHLSELAVFSRETDVLYHKPVLSLLHHPYVQLFAKEEVAQLQAQIAQNNWVYVDSKKLAEYHQLSSICRVPNTPLEVLQYVRGLIYTFAALEDIDKFDKEYLYQTLLIVNRVEKLLTRHTDITMAVKTLYHILLQLMEGTSVPFDGEPLQGLQIMGMLESRSMDFHTLIVPDVNDETLPGKTLQNTYIPYDLRLYFGLPTAERQDAIFAYNFYRLISHAQDVWLLQNTQSNELTSGEVSRYVYQLQYQYDIPLEQVDINDVPAAPDTQMPSVEKTPEVLQNTREVLQKNGLSASALNVYVACPLRFYWETIQRLKEPKNVHEELQANEMGTVLHAVMEALYGNPDRPYKVCEADIVRFMERVQDTPLVEKVYVREVYASDDLSLLTGRDQLAVYAIKKYVRNILAHDKTLCPFFYHSSEKRLKTTFPMPNGETICIKGFIDRIDEVNGCIRMIDYKTGSEHSTKVKMGELFAATNALKADHYRQTLFYALLYTSAHSGADCGATIYYTSKQPDTIEKELFTSFAAIEGYRESLAAVLEEILNPALPFEARPEAKRCEYCPFAAMCGQ